MLQVYKLIAIKLSQFMTVFSVIIYKILKIIYTFNEKMGAMLTGKAFCLFALCLTLWACSTPVIDIGSISWKTYSNSRYGFEFPYPSNWTPSITPTNDDGIALVSPKSSDVEIRAWASNRLAQPIDAGREISANYNFQTTQGLKGRLLVETGNTVSSMKLTLIQNQVDYHWQGKSPSQEFSGYYSLFYYIAQQYRVTRR
jgi:hypothetical protein